MRAGTAPREVLVVLSTLLVLGAVCGGLWWLLVDPAVYVKVSGAGSMGELQLDKRFNPDGWYAVIAAVAGLFAGVLLSWWRSDDPLLTTVLLALGAAGAAGVMAVVGYLLGPGDPDVALAVASAGEEVPLPLVVTAKAGYLVWPMAALVGALLVLWSVPPPSGPDGDTVSEH